MFTHYTLALAAGASLLAKVIATDCNPIEETDCDSDAGLTSSTYSVDFTSGADDDNWESVGCGDVNYTASGAEFTINEQGDSPTLQTSWYIFFGRVEVHMKLHPVLASSPVLFFSPMITMKCSDWEWLGGYPDEVQTNYFGKGISTSSGRDTIEAVDDAQDTSHNYTLYWTQESLSWYLDGNLLRTVTYSDASSGDEYPQTPSRVKLGIWAGGDGENAAGTISWAGGKTDYDEGPFTMIVESVDITNFNPAENYTYSDQTGDYTSIEFDAASDSEDDSDTTVSTSSAKSSATTLTTSISPVTVSTDLGTTETPAATGSANQDSGNTNSDTSNSDNSGSGGGAGSNDSSDKSSGSNSGNQNSDQNSGNSHGKSFGHNMGTKSGNSSTDGGGSFTNSFAKDAGGKGFI
ncbi:hypothetical protein G7Z17_g584 [Cylindrodendrum hubeiense]|uniref:GH16 domain-containing protein n=1 Tax=Cylindrodendrum hubeiense TaxID=595255 RepID=A0A9P5LN17_9HYPO|nr:hypothetical protein G7Z17_g584 [Cylindrodendrum hubeiense]